MKEVEQDPRKWGDICVCGIEDLVLLKCVHGQCNVMQFFQNFHDIFHETRKKHSTKIVLEAQKTLKIQMSKKSKTRGITLPDFKIKFKATVLE